MAATTLHAATLCNATIGCQHSCVTVTLSWAAEPFGVYSAAVEDSFDNVIFTLNQDPTLQPSGESRISTIERGEVVVAPELFNEERRLRVRAHQRRSAT